MNVGAIVYALPPSFVLDEASFYVFQAEKHLPSLRLVIISIFSFFILIFFSFSYFGMRITF